MPAQYGKEVDMATELTSVPVNATNEPLDRRLHDIGWGLLLMLTGMIWLVPAERVPEGAWLVGVAAILFGLNAVRYVKHISVSGFSLVLGLAALLAAFSRSWRTDLPVLAICLLIIGASLVAKPLLTKTT
jgi:hypothetical protein